MNAEAGQGWFRTLVEGTFLYAAGHDLWEWGFKTVAWGWELGAAQLPQGEIGNVVTEEVNQEENGRNRAARVRWHII